MRATLIYIICFFFALQLSSQRKAGYDENNNANTVKVYLTTGSIIKGEINEWKEGEYLDIKTSWSESVVYTDDSIEKVVVAEDDEEETVGNSRKVRLLGFNMTQMITQFMPFSDRVDQAGPFQFKYMGGGGGHLFNMQLGAGRIQPDNSDNIFFFEQTETYVSMVFGYARFKNVNQKFYHYFSQNLMISSGFLNQPGEDFGSEEEFFAFNGAWGVGYKLTPKISICTELQFILSLDGGLGIGSAERIQFIPPIGLFLVAHL